MRLRHPPGFGVRLDVCGRPRVDHHSGSGLVSDLPPLNEATSGARIPGGEPAPISDPARVLARQGG